MNADNVVGERTPPCLGPGLFPTPEIRHDEILEHLEQVLSHPLFCHSKRYAAVLRYIVELTLQGNKAQLKERTIGIEVFHRAPDYDTANDHVVRSAMSEVRRRLAQYYKDSESESEVKIELQPGSYVPHFGRGAASAPEHKLVPVGTPVATRSEALPLYTHHADPYLAPNFASGNPCHGCRGCHFVFRGILEGSSANLLGASAFRARSRAALCGNARAKAVNPLAVPQTPNP